MEKELPKIYEPQNLEKQAADIWSAANAFRAEPDGKVKSYTIVIPPPNVTAALHLGHALNNTLQDILIRFRRMQGFNTLWMPGTDHAGIATQTVVEKRILSEEGRRRTDFARDDFIARIQQWKDEYETKIIEQLKTMGCSCDWERTRFTMDETCARAVRECFFKLFSDGLIYRGKRLVNWDPATQTVLADDEVEHETIQGHFWYLKYPLEVPVEIEGGKLEYVTVATTRPETMLGDTAVAMNPADGRAKYLVGKKVRLPIVGRLIPIIADEHVVLADPNSEDEKARFSTGFLKVTPAHDPYDWEIGQRHNLEVINVMAPDGSISDKFGWADSQQPEAQNLLGMDRFEAREAIVEWFRTENLLEQIKEYSHEVGHSYRSHVPIEPYLSDQWYIAVKKPIDSLAKKFGTGLIEGTDVPVNSLAGLALKPLLDGRLKFIPERYAKTYQTWLENLRDWPISRQLWWGHQIPVWHKRIILTEKNWCDELVTFLGWDHQVDDLKKGKYPDDGYIRIVKVSEQIEVNPFDDPLMPIVKETEGEYDIYICYLHDTENCKQCKKAVEALKKRGYERDPDVLDTWFSSALWPFSTLGWPQESDSLKTFYPGDVLCTAREIITLWVSRMVMMGQYCADDIPFKDVFIHAMIQDGEGRKMSKSLGNGIDPLAIISSHGADAMRFTLASMTTETQDVRMPVMLMELPDGRKENSSPKFDLGRNFCNKLWNASRFAMMNLDGVDPAQFDAAKLDITDKWILSRLAAVIDQTTASLDSFKFSEPINELYRFFWNDFCDWYLEWTKYRVRNEEQKQTAQNVLAFVLDTVLRLLHPFVPFITEAIFDKLNEMIAHRKLNGIAEAVSSDILVKAQWPQPLKPLIDSESENQIQTIQTVIRAIRDMRSKYNKAPGEKLTASAKISAGQVDMFDKNSNLVCQLANLKKFTVSNSLQKPENAAATIVEQMEIYLHDAVDIAAERNRLEKQKEELEKAKKANEGKLANENFISRAKPEVVEQTRRRLEELTEQLAAVEKYLSELN
ncbi:MAG: valine--tRNA ligase [Phycisphaerae bacterium]|nr:valine--tRNA ligase [Phycisphaerae bacterium]